MLAKSSVTPAVSEIAGTFSGLLLPSRATQATTRRGGSTTAWWTSGRR